MTTTARGPSGLHLKQFAIAVLAAVTLALVVFAIGQWFDSDSQTSVLQPTEVRTEASVPSVTSYGLSQALADGKLDAGLIPARDSTAPVEVETPVPKTVVVTGQGDLYDDLVAGKFSMEFASQNPGVEFVKASEASGLWKDLADGKFGEAVIPVETKPSVDRLVPETIVITGQSDLYDDLVAGKFSMEFASQNPGVEFVRASEASGLWKDLADGKLDDGTANADPVIGPSSPATYDPAVSGGHQE